MFTKQTGSSRKAHPDHPPQANIDRIHPVHLEPVKTLEPPTLVNGSVIGADLTILGENINIVSRDTLQIDGEIHGDVSGKKINIGTGGRVVGTISAEAVQIDGSVSGTVRAMAVQLNAEAKVSGELLHGTLIIHEGAEFEGSVRRPKDAGELQPNLQGNPALPEPMAQPLAAPARQDTESAFTEPLGAPLTPKTLES